VANQVPEMKRLVLGFVLLAACDRIVELLPQPDANQFQPDGSGVIDDAVVGDGDDGGGLDGGVDAGIGDAPVD
jgi:hypothetical protein